MVGSNRWQFLLDSLETLSKNISKVNPASQLLVVRGPPQSLLPALFKQWRISHLVFEEDDDDYTRARDEAVVKAASKAGVQVISKAGHTLYRASDVLAQHKNEPFISYGPFVKALEKLPLPAKPLPAPSHLPSPGNTDLSDLLREDHSVAEHQSRDLNAECKETQDTTYHTFAGPKGTFTVPTFEELGLKPATSNHRGGEDNALGILELWLKDRVDELLKFEKPKTSPAAFAPAQSVSCCCTR